MAGVDQSEATSDTQRTISGRLRLGAAAVGVLALLLACCAWATCLWLGVGAPSDKDHFDAHRAEYQRAADNAIARARAKHPATLENRYALDERVRDLSDGGEIWVVSHPGRGYWVAFFRSRGILGQGRRLIYCSQPWTVSEMREYFDEVEPIDDGWFLTYEY
jgi:hypothetical protein